ncbi:caspase family protein [[Eubacterium] tenue]|nr:caspase family protein [[Eubacterium] tenue]MBC8630138.1 caspase family protein [[Eubacterium] tenue]
MKIAILIGVSEYITQQNLPACKNDVELMNTLITEINQYDEILYIRENTDSQQIKDKLFDFIERYKNEMDKNSDFQIDEILFYFTGHGMSDSEDFYYITSDFDYSRLNTTTIKNSELDEAIRRLNPKLTVKIVDACESGTRYIKDSTENSLKCIDVSKGQLSDCYFMYSSHNNQSSMANTNFSFFTKVFIDSIIDKKQGNHRYTDIANYIRDVFRDKGIKQTPYFVSQASNLETFCIVTEDLKTNLSRFIENVIHNDGQCLDLQQENKEQKKLLEIVKEDSEKYCESIEEVSDTLEYIKEIITNMTVENEDINGLYSCASIFKNETNDISRLDEVAKILNNSDIGWFVNIQMNKKEIKPKKNQLITNFSYLIGEEIKYENIICGFSISEENIPYKSISIDFNPNFPNIEKYNCSIVFAFSKSEIILFYSLNKYIEVSWGKYELPKNISWINKKELLKDKDSIREAIEQIKTTCISVIRKDLENKFISDIE